MGDHFENGDVRNFHGILFGLFSLIYIYINTKFCHILISCVSNFRCKKWMRSVPRPNWKKWRHLDFFFILRREIPTYWEVSSQSEKQRLRKGAETFNKFNERRIKIITEEEEHSKNNKYPTNFVVSDLITIYVSAKCVEVASRFRIYFWYTQLNCILLIITA